MATTRRETTGEAATTGAVDVLAVPTPLGPLRVVVRAGVVAQAAFGDGDRDGHDVSGRGREPRHPVERALVAYFDGDVGALDRIPAEVPAASAFQRRVWAALRTIPVGETRTYGELAAMVGAPGAARAVGRANATNPIALIVPCHRVVPATGGVGGYAAGTDRKAWLLAHERAPRV
jgi:methylated-DNA-[protein]-cysteine S-methyltransferase